VVNAPPREEAPGHVTACVPGQSGQAWRAEYLLHPPVFDPRTVQPVASEQKFKVTWFTSANNIFFLVFLLLGDSPAAEFYSRRFGTICSIFIGGVSVFFLTPPMDMEQSSETSSYTIQKPWSSYRKNTTFRTGRNFEIADMLCYFMSRRPCVCVTVIVSGGGGGFMPKTAM
jgi:hypothetical protein